MSWPVEARLEIVERLWPRPFVARVQNRTVRVLEGTPITRELVAHELRHVFDRWRLGPLWLPAYAGAWLLALGSHERNHYERLARAAETDPHFLAWADDVIEAAAAAWWAS